MNRSRKDALHGLVTSMSRYSVWVLSLMLLAMGPSSAGVAEGSIHRLGLGKVLSDAPGLYLPSASLIPRQPKATGTGVVLDRSGRVLTSRHVVTGCSTNLLHHDNDVIPARLDVEDARVDLAILVPERPIAADIAKFRDEPVIKGESIVAAGFPREVVHQGLLKAISARVVALEYPSVSQAMMRISATVNPGTSGGPVLDRAGRVVGIVAGMLYADSNGLPVDNPGLAVRAEVVRRFLTQSGIRITVDRAKRSESLQTIASAAARYTVLVECLN